jgi:hypothetical protein
VFLFFLFGQGLVEGAGTEALQVDVDTFEAGVFRFSLLVKGSKRYTVLYEENEEAIIIA